MAHNIDMTGGKANVAFVGSRNDIWHRLGTQMQSGMTIEQWAEASGLNWEAVLLPSFSQLPDGSMVEVDDEKHIHRADNFTKLGTCSNVWKSVQPKECLDWFQQYIAHDDRFQLDVAGSLCGGKKVWATATFNGGMVVGGDQHVMRLLMTTTFDVTGATINKGTATRVVCNNTLDAALSIGGCEVKTRHSAKFNHEKVGRELAAIVAGFEGYKAMGDAMAKHHMSEDQVSNFFKKCLGIPFDAKQDEVSTRKLNQYNELNDAYVRTCAEGTEPLTAWSALNAVTRYVDHDRGTRDTGHGEVESRFVSAQFTSGAAMKAKAVETLYEMSDGELLKAVAAKTQSDSWIGQVLAKPLIRQ